MRKRATTLVLMMIIFSVSTQPALASDNSQAAFSGPLIGGSITNFFDIPAYNSYQLYWTYTGTQPSFTVTCTNISTGARQTQVVPASPVTFSTGITPRTGYDCTVTDGIDSARTRLMTLYFQSGQNPGIMLDDFRGPQGEYVYRIYWTGDATASYTPHVDGKARALGGIFTRSREIHFEPLQDNSTAINGPSTEVRWGAKAKSDYDGLEFVTNASQTCIALYLTWEKYNNIYIGNTNIYYQGLGAMNIKGTTNVLGTWIYFPTRYACQDDYAPQSPVVIAVGGNRQVSLAWTTEPDGPADDIFFEVFQTDAAGGNPQLLTTTYNNYFTHTALQPNTTYYYKVRATMPFFWRSADSVVVSARTL